LRERPAATESREREMTPLGKVGKSIRMIFSFFSFIQKNHTGYGEVYALIIDRNMNYFFFSRYV
jgi:hypothetical protein